jgi:hypothetical protein
VRNARKPYMLLVGKHLGKIFQIIKMGFIGSEDVNCTEKLQDHVQWRVFYSKALND